MMATLLRVPRVGRTDDFFALGGYSILAVSLFNEIEREFNRRIPLATLFRAPTVAALAIELTGEPSQAKGWDSLVPIQTLGTKPRFFCVHGAGGNILLYRDLVRTLGNDYPFYGLQSQGLDRKTKPLTTVEEMAEHYLREIRSLQPNGPYCLGGYCLGGTIAYEMAQRLQSEGQEVALLALFDTYNFTQMNKAKTLPYLWQKIAFHGRNLASLSWKDLSGYLTSKIRVATDGELRALLKNLFKALWSERARKNHKTAEGTIQEINDAAAAAYRPRPYAGSLTVFKPKKNYNFFPDPKMGWSNTVTGELDVAALPVNPHAMLVTPFVQHLTRELRQRLDAVETRKKTAAVLV
jgi:thioesterase domain-containing protein